MGQPLDEPRVDVSTFRRVLWDSRWMPRVANGAVLWDLHAYRSLKTL